MSSFTPIISQSLSSQRGVPYRLVLENSIVSAAFYYSYYGTVAPPVTVEIYIERVGGGSPEIYPWAGKYIYEKYMSLSEYGDIQDERWTYLFHGMQGITGLVWTTSNNEEFNGTVGFCTSETYMPVDIVG